MVATSLSSKDSDRKNELSFLFFEGKDETCVVTDGFT